MDGMEAQVKILVVDDEPQIRRALKNALEGESAQIIEAGTAAAAVDAVATARPDLIVLDLGLPDMDGIRVCREVRQWSAVPIIVLSVRRSESEKVALLDAGADDYMTKPFSTAELQARVRAHLRRAHTSKEAPAPLALPDGLMIDVLKRTVRRGSEDVHLTPTEWAVLKVFIANEGRTLTHQQIFRAVWPNSAGDAQQYLRVQVANLRAKLESDAVRPRLIITEPGVGYRFEITR
jgi:two-component system KDP operon response regulator KdpE